MQRFFIDYTDATGEQAQTTVVAANESKAKRAFAAKHPDVDASHILRIATEAEAAEKLAASASKSESHANTASTGTGAHTANPPSSSPISNDVHTDFKATRVCSKLFEYLGWGTIIVGVLTGLGTIAEGDTIFMGVRFSGFMAGLGTIFSSLVTGLVIILIAQAARAVVENANHTKAILIHLHSSNR